MPVSALRNLDGEIIMLPNGSTLPCEMFLNSQVRTAEQKFVDSGNTDFYRLVESAGTAAFEQIEMAQDKSCSILVLVGYGNNGADGYVCARRLLEAGYRVALMAFTREQMGEEVLKAQKLFIESGGEVERFSPKKLISADVIIDGLLGTGFSGDIKGDFKLAIDSINSSDAWVFSLDIPSGISADTGTGVNAVVADVTLTFGAVKQGLMTGRARHCVGQLLFTALGLTEYLPQANSINVSIDYVNQHMKPRDRDSHKGLSGKVSVIGGDTGMAGAVRLAGEACLRAGAGLVTVISRPEHQIVVNSNRPELMFWGCELVDMEVYLRLGWANILVIGPGLGKQDWGYNLLKAVGLTDKPCVMDADALNLLSAEHGRQEHWVLTPHSGEAARLLGISTQEVENDRFAAVKDIQQKYGGVVVLKGPGTLIYDGLQCYVAPVGNPGLASGGCGDVLSGIIAALMAQGFDKLSSAIMGVVVHGEAADRAAMDGERGMLASDLMPYIRKLVNKI